MAQNKNLRERKICCDLKVRLCKKSEFCNVSNCLRIKKVLKSHRGWFLCLLFSIERRRWFIRRSIFKIDWIVITIFITPWKYSNRLVDECLTYFGYYSFYTRAYLTKTWAAAWRGARSLCQLIASYVKWFASLCNSFPLLSTDLSQLSTDRLLFHKFDYFVCFQTSTKGRPSN